MASRIGRLGPSASSGVPDWLYGAFNPNDKTNLAPYPGISLLPQFVEQDFRLPQVVRTKPFRKPTIDRREEL
jgi:hypothetical protein